MAMKEKEIKDVQLPNQVKFNLANGKSIDVGPLTLRTMIWAKKYDGIENVLKAIGSNKPDIEIMAEFIWEVMTNREDFLGDFEHFTNSVDVMSLINSVTGLMSMAADSLPAPAKAKPGDGSGKKPIGRTGSRRSAGTTPPTT
jgi:hypothetical protein